MFNEISIKPRFYSESFDASSFRRIFCVGDIHGCFDLLQTQLNVKGFDPEQDLLVSVGDLVDRGPDSAGFIRYIYQPWFKRVIGNHEVIAQLEGWYCHLQNGGAWLWHDIQTEQGSLEVKRILAELQDAPIALEVKTPTGKLLGFTHAGVPCQPPRTWQKVMELANAGDAYLCDQLLWDRTTIQTAKQKPHAKPLTVEGVDWCFAGHTPVKQVVVGGNQVWLDTGAFATNVLTVLEVTDGYVHPTVFNA